MTPDVHADADAEPDPGLTPDALQLAFHEIECRTYDERFGIAYDRGTAAAVRREIARSLGRGLLGRVLDVGCGTGYLAVGLAASGAAAEVHATDLSPGMLHRARANAERLGAEVRFARSTATALPYRAGTFDAVVTRGVLHHMHDPVAALREWRRVVVPGGPVLVTSEPSPAADRIGGAVARATQRGLAVARRLSAAVGRPLSRHDPTTAAENEYWDLVAMAANLHTFSAEDLRRLAEEAGFTDVRTDGAGLASIAWAAMFHVVAGDVPGVGDSRQARWLADRAYALLREVDARLLDRLVPDDALTTVRAVFAG